MTLRTSTDRPADDALLSGPRALITVSVFAIITVLAFEQVAVGTAMPRVAEKLDGVALYGMAFAAPTALAVVAMTVSGSWNDRRGPTLPMTGGTLIAVAGLVISGSAGMMAVVALGRGVMGFGAGLILVSVYVLIGRAYPEAARPRMFAVITSAWVLPTVLGPLAAGWLADSLGWPWVFLAVIPILLVAWAALLAGVRAADVSGRHPDADDEHHDGGTDGEQADGRSGDDAAGASPDADGPVVESPTRRVAWSLVAAAGVLSLTLAADGLDGAARAAFTLVAGAVVLLAGSRLIPPGVLRGVRGLPSVIGQRALMGAAFAATESWIPLMLTTHRGWSLTAAGWYLTPAALSWFGGSWLASRPERLSPRVAVVLGPVLLVTGIGSAALGLVEVPGFTVPVAVLVAGWGLAGAGMGLTYPVLSAATLRLSSPGDQGVNSAALQLSESLASSLTLALGGVAFAAIAGAGATIATGSSDQPASTPGLLACFALAGALAALAVVVARRGEPGDLAEDTPADPA